MDLLVGLLIILSATITTTAFAQKPNSLADVMSTLQPENAPQTEKPSNYLETKLKLIRENDRRKAEAARVAALAQQAQAAASLKPPCQPPGELPNFNFKSPLLVPPSKPWPDAAAAFASGGYSNVQATVADLTSIARDPQFPKPTREMTVTIVVARNVGWKTEDLNRSMARVAGLYARCGIQMKLATVTADLPNGTTAVDKEIEKSVSRNTPVKIRPVIYFIDKNTDVIGRPEDGGGYALAWNREACETDFFVGKKTPSYCGTVWLGREAIVRRFSDGQEVERHIQPVEGDRKVVPIAHELAHLLGNRDHLYGGTNNILQGDPKKISVDFTAEQCEAFRNNTDYVHPIGSAN